MPKDYKGAMNDEEGKESDDDEEQSGYGLYWALLLGVSSMITMPSERATCR